MRMVVTITGADDAVDPEVLFRLSAIFPFVEWGILYSAKHAGSPRFPSIAWIERFTDLIVSSRRSNTSLHLCGSACRDFVKHGFGVSMPFRLHTFDRIQLNGYDGQVSVDCRPDYLILQCRSIDDLPRFIVNARRRASILLDPSGGRGKLVESWPRAHYDFPMGDFPMGIAGGIGPDNVVDSIRRAVDCGIRWIDMETGVRDAQDRFDIKKVWQVLRSAAEVGEVGGYDPGFREIMVAHDSLDRAGAPIFDANGAPMSLADRISALAKEIKE
jgi:hypothetical protein